MCPPPPPKFILCGFVNMFYMHIFGWGRAVRCTTIVSCSRQALQLDSRERRDDLLLYRAIIIIFFCHIKYAGGEPDVYGNFNCRPTMYVFHIRAVSVRISFSLVKPAKTLDFGTKRTITTIMHHSSFPIYIYISRHVASISSFIIFIYGCAFLHLLALEIIIHDFQEQPRRKRTMGQDAHDEAHDARLTFGEVVLATRGRIGKMCNPCSAYSVSAHN